MSLLSDEHWHASRIYGRERAVLEGQAIAPAAAFDAVSCFGRCLQRDEVTTVRTGDLLRDRRAPGAGLLPQPEGEARSVGAVDDAAVARCRALRVGRGCP